MATKVKTLSADLSPERRLRFHEVETLTGMRRTKLYSLIKQGKFPKGEDYGPRCKRWRAGTVVDHLNGLAMQAATEKQAVS